MFAPPRAEHITELADATRRAGKRAAASVRNRHRVPAFSCHLINRGGSTNFTV